MSDLPSKSDTLSKPSGTDGGPIVLLTTALDWGGTEGNVVALALGYQRRNIHPVVVVDHGPLHRLPALEAAGIEVHVLDTAPDWSSVRYRTALRQVLKQVKARIVHANIWERQAEAFQAVRSLRLPLVYTVHTTIPLKAQVKTAFTKKLLPYLKLRWAYIKENPVVINISDVSDANFRRRFPQVRTTRRIYLGTYVPPVASDASAGGQAAQVLWVGSMIERKRPLWALEVWRQVVARCPQAHLRLVGGGPLLDEARAQGASFPPGTLTIPGNVSDMSDLLEQSQIMFHTAMQEGIPTNILYANTFGIPTVSTDVGAIPEAVQQGKTGFLVNVEDQDALVEGLCTLIQDPERRGEMGRAARALGETHFDLEQHIDETLRVYAEVCGVPVTAAPLQQRTRPATLN